MSTAAGGLTAAKRWEASAAILAAIGFPLVFVFLVVLARDLSFFHDEWDFILNRTLTIDGLLTPWFGHALVLPVLLWRVLIGLFGTGSYWPFLGGLWVAHGAVVIAVYLLARDHAPTTWAVGAALVMAVLGAGWQNILWAYQVSMTGAIALGLFALWIVPRRPAVAAGLLTAAVMSQGTGLAFVAGGALYLLIARPRATPWMLLPTIVWGTWYMTFGAAAPFENVEALPGYVAVGIGFAVAGVLGTQVLAVGAVAVVAFVALRPRLTPDQWGLLAVVLVFFAISGLARGSQTALQPRFVYAVAPAILVVGTAAFSRVGYSRYLGIALLTFALVGNVGLMVSGHQTRLDRERCEEAHIPIAERMLPDAARSYSC